MDRQDIHDTIRAVAYHGGALRLLDQRKLPATETYIECQSAEDVAAAISDLVVRGARTHNLRNLDLDLPRFRQFFGLFDHFVPGFRRLLPPGADRIRQPTTR